MAGQNIQSDLAAVEIHDVLSNERRQMVLTLLREENGQMTARDLSEQIAEFETGENPPPRNIRQSVYVSLHQTHLPKLDELEIIEYDQSAKTVTLQDRADQVRVYMETVPKYGISWSEYYLGIGIIGLLILIASQVGVPVIAELGIIVWSGLLFFLITVSAIYQTIQQGSSLLHRIYE